MIYVGEGAGSGAAEDRGPRGATGKGEMDEVPRPGLCVGSEEHVPVNPFGAVRVDAVEEVHQGGPLGSGVPDEVAELTRQAAELREGHDGFLKR